MLRRFSDKAKDEEGIFSIFMTDDGEKVSYIVTSKPMIILALKT